MFLALFQGKKSPNKKFQRVPKRPLKYANLASVGSAVLIFVYNLDYFFV